MFNLANFFTASNLISGIMAILLAVSGRLDLAPYALLCGALFDFLDGFAARIFKTSGDLGKQLDSLADMVTFGVAPGIIMMVLLSAEPIEYLGDLGAINYKKEFSDWFESIANLEADARYFPFISILIPFFSMFRLAKFNIDNRQTDSFIGMPTPANTLFFMSFPLVLSYSEPISNELIWLYEIIFSPWILAGLIIFMCLLMVSEIKLFSLKFRTFKFVGNEIRIIFLLISLGLILIFQFWSISLIVFLYLILSFVDNKFLKRLKNEI